MEETISLSYKRQTVQCQDVETYFTGKVFARNLACFGDRAWMIIPVSIWLAIVPCWDSLGDVPPLSGSRLATWRGSSGVFIQFCRQIQTPTNVGLEICIVGLGCACVDRVSRVSTATYYHDQHYLPLTIIGVIAAAAANTATPS